MSESPEVFSWPVRVYFQDTDAGGVTYHASYVNFMERARTEWLRTFGFSNAGLMKTLGVVFVVRSLSLEYFRPALLDDLLQVTAAVTGLGRSRLTLSQTVLRGEEKLAEGEIHLVCVDVATFKPVSVPDILRSQWKE
jgi:acyl-CoA thioester hydrolase